MDRSGCPPRSGGTQLYCAPAAVSARNLPVPVRLAPRQHRVACNSPHRNPARSASDPVPRGAGCASRPHPTRAHRSLTQPGLVLFGLLPFQRAPRNPPRPHQLRRECERPTVGLPNLDAAQPVGLSRSRVGRTPFGSRRDSSGDASTPWPAWFGECWDVWGRRGERSGRNRRGVRGEWGERKVRILEISGPASKVR